MFASAAAYALSLVSLIAKQCASYQGVGKARAVARIVLFALLGRQV